MRRICIKIGKKKHFLMINYHKNDGFLHEKRGYFNRNNIADSEVDKRTNSLKTDT